LGGSALIINALPLKFLRKRYEKASNMTVII